MQKVSKISNSQSALVTVLFRVELKLVRGVADLPRLEDNIAFADNVCGNLFNNIYFNMGSQTVSFISNGVAQCDILKSRLTKNPSYNKSIGNAQGLNGHHFERFNQLFDIGNTISVDIGADAAHPDVRHGVAVNYETRRRLVSEQGRFRRSFIWQPSLGIMEYSLPMACGEYEFQLNPSTDYQTACVDSGTAANMLNVANVKCEVVDIRFYACMCRINQPVSGSEVINLMEMEVMNYTMNGLPVDPAPERLLGTSIGINQEFTVPSSTRAITMFIQDQSAGKQTSCPPSRFTNRAPYNMDSLSLHDYQIECKHDQTPDSNRYIVFQYNKSDVSALYFNRTRKRGILYAHGV